MKKVVFFNTKGGTGKTTICFNYGWYLAEKRNKKVLLIDFDPQVNLVQAFNSATVNKNGNNLDTLIISFIKGKEINLKDYIISVNHKIDLLPSSNNISLLEEYLTDYVVRKTFNERKLYKAIHRNRMIKDMLEEKIDNEDYDYVVIDSQPNFSLLSTISLIYARNILVVIKPELFSFLDIDYLKKILKNMEKKFYFKIKIVGIIINAYEKRKKISKYIVSKLNDEYGKDLRVFDQKIRYLTSYQKSIALKREPVFKSFPKSEASKDILELFSEIDKIEHMFYGF